MKYFALLLLFMASLQSHAQAALAAILFGDKVATENFNIGMEFGIPLANISDVDGSSSKTGVNFGISANIKLNDNWSLHPNAFFLSRRGANVDALSLNSDDPELNVKFQEVPATVKVNYIDVPIFVNYRFTNSNFKVGLAPQISFRTGANAIFTNAQGDFDFTIDNATHSIDFGLVTQVGYVLFSEKKQKEIHVQLRYFQGFTDVYDDSLIPGNNTSHYFALFLSFPFIAKDNEAPVPN